MTREDRKLRTVGDIARLASVPVHRVAYVIRSRGVQPVSRAGNLRVFSHSATRAILGHLDRISQVRATQGN